MAGLEICNLYKSFNIKDKKVDALYDINLKIEDQSFLTIVGKSGCGKTTLLRIICNLDKQNNGDIKFTNCKNNISPKIGMVFQESRLMPWLTIEQNMAFPLMRCNDKNHVNKVVNKYLKMLELEEFKGAYPNQISGGMAQRAALGRTLCYDPEIILMDEPFGALDAFNRRKLQNEFINIFLKNKKTIIFVTHDVEEAIYLGQKVIVMEDGKIIDKIPVNIDYYNRNINSKEFLFLREKILKFFY